MWLFELIISVLRFKILIFVLQQKEQLEKLRDEAWKRSHRADIINKIDKVQKKIDRHKKKQAEEEEEETEEKTKKSSRNEKKREERKRRRKNCRRKRRKNRDYQI